MLTNKLVSNKISFMNFMSGKLKIKVTFINFGIIVIYSGPKMDLECQKTFEPLKFGFYDTFIFYKCLAHHIFSLNCVFHMRSGV